MNIYILRHGPAAKSLGLHAMRDSLRPLTPKGRKKVRQVAAAMRAMDLSLDLILTSPCVRARQTAEIVADEFRARQKLETLGELSVEVEARAALEKLARLHLPPENLLLVGHEPQLGQLVSLLLCGHPRLKLQLKKAGLCKLCAPSLRANSRATLEWLLTPKQICL